MKKIIAQFLVSGFGTSEQVTQRHRFEELLESEFFANRAAAVDGGECGDGTMNIWIYPVYDVDKAIQTVLAAIQEGTVLGSVVVAKSEDGQNARWEVVWPPRHTGTFSPHVTSGLD